MAYMPDKEAGPTPMSVDNSPAIVVITSQDEAGDQPPKAPDATSFGIANLIDMDDPLVDAIDLGLFINSNVEGPGKVTVARFFLQRSLTVRRSMATMVVKQQLKDETERHQVIVFISRMSPVVEAPTAPAAPQLALQTERPNSGASGSNGSSAMEGLSSTAQACKPQALAERQLKQAIALALDGMKTEGDKLTPESTMKKNLENLVKELLSVTSTDYHLPLRKIRAAVQVAHSDDETILRINIIYTSILGLLLHESAVLRADMHVPNETKKSYQKNFTELASKLEKAYDNGMAADENMAGMIAHFVCTKLCKDEMDRDETDKTRFPAVFSMAPALQPMMTQRLSEYSLLAIFCGCLCLAIDVDAEAARHAPTVVPAPTTCESVISTITLAEAVAAAGAAATGATRPLSTAGWKNVKGSEICNGLLKCPPKAWRNEGRLLKRAKVVLLETNCPGDQVEFIVIAVKRRMEAWVEADDKRHTELQRAAPLSAKDFLPTVWAILLDTEKQVTMHGDALPQDFMALVSIAKIFAQLATQSKVGKEVRCVITKFRVFPFVRASEDPEKHTLLMHMRRASFNITGLAYELLLQKAGGVGGMAGVANSCGQAIEMLECAAEALDSRIVHPAVAEKLNQKRTKFTTSFDKDKGERQGTRVLAAVGGVQLAADAANDKLDSIMRVLDRMVSGSSAKRWTPADDEEMDMEVGSGRRVRPRSLIFSPHQQGDKPVMQEEQSDHQGANLLARFQEALAATAAATEEPVRACGPAVAAVHGPCAAGRVGPGAPTMRASCQDTRPVLDAPESNRPNHSGVAEGDTSQPLIERFATFNIHTPAAVPGPQAQGARGRAAGQTSSLASVPRLAAASRQPSRFGGNHQSSAPAATDATKGAASSTVGTSMPQPKKSPASRIPSGEDSTALAEQQVIKPSPLRSKIPMSAPITAAGSKSGPIPAPGSKPRLVPATGAKTAAAPGSKASSSITTRPVRK